MLKIERIRLYHGQMPCDVEFSYGSARSCPFAVAQVFAGGHMGVGEALHATVDGCVAMARGLIGQDALKLDQYIPGERFTWQKIVHKELFSMALHDLVARSASLPLHVLMGGKRRDRIQMMCCIFPKSPQHAGEMARKFADLGFKAMKVKNFGKADLDLAIIREVRKVFPEGFLQADANCGYKTLDEVRSILPRLAEAGLTAAEDPADATPEEYAELLAVSPRPLIILDACTRGDAAVEKVARWRSGDAVNFHPNMQGTFSDIRDRIACVRLAGLGVEIGGTGYTGVGAFAHLHVAAVYGENYPYGEIGGWMDHGMPYRTALQGLPIVDGYAVVPDTPGHGGDLDERSLAASSNCVEVT
jgi:L-alanine-DL-glutamate epimerase-like enolase superfamily enzyme